MSEAQITIASAVVIPPSNSDRRLSSSSPTLTKRRESSDHTESSEAKRPKLDHDKGRGRRLFGSILGNLGKPSVDTRTKKRLEVEAKMQEKLKVQREESEAAKGVKRMEEKKEWEVQADRVRKSNDKAMANFLVTKTKPSIYYLPWKLTPTQSSTIESQLSHASSHSSSSPPPPPPQTSQTEQHNNHSHTRSRSHSRSHSKSRSRSRDQAPGRSRSPPNVDKMDDITDTLPLKDTSEEPNGTNASIRQEVTNDDDQEGEETAAVAMGETGDVKMKEDKHEPEPEEEPMKVDMGNDEDVVVEY